MLWYGILRKNGQVVLKRLWHPTNTKVAATVKSTKEVFGPFEAATPQDAERELRKIVTAVGFRIPGNVVQE